MSARGSGAGESAHLALDGGTVPGRGTRCIAGCRGGRGRKLPVMYTLATCFNQGTLQQTCSHTQAWHTHKTQLWHAPTRSLTRLPQRHDGLGPTPTTTTATRGPPADEPVQQQYQQRKQQGCERQQDQMGCPSLALGPPAPSPRIQVSWERRSCPCLAQGYGPHERTSAGVRAGQQARGHCLSLPPVPAMLTTRPARTDVTRGSTAIP